MVWRIQNPIVVVPVLLMLSFSRAWANQPSFSSMVVKITSELCNLPTSRHQGSGFLFQNGGKSYVLTSDHVILHSNKNVCHSIWNTVIGNQKATFRFSDWGEGFALLEVPQLTPQTGWEDLTQYWSINPSDIRSVAVAGFPHSSKTLIASSSNRVDKYGPELFYSSGDRSLRIHDIHVEFGMSGGPIFGTGFYNNGAGGFVGIATHEQIEANGSTILFGLTRDSIGRILEGHFRMRGYIEPFLWQDISAQSAKVETVYSDEYKFEFDCSKKPCSVKVSTQPNNSWGQPLPADRALSMEIADRIAKGEVLPHPYYDRITWTLTEAMKGLPKTKKATIRKFRWSQGYIKKDPSLKNKLQLFNSAPEFFHTLVSGFAGHVWDPVYE